MPRRLGEASNEPVRQRSEWVRPRTEPVKRSTCSVVLATRRVEGSIRSLRRPTGSVAQPTRSVPHPNGSFPRFPGSSPLRVHSTCSPEGLACTGHCMYSPSVKVDFNASLLDGGAMKLRSMLLVLVALLLVAGVAGAAPAPDASPVAAPAVSAAASSSMDAPACGSSTSTLDAAIFSPAPSARAFNNSCGSCSSSPCAGAANNAVCGFRGGLFGHCLSPLGDQCTSGGWACQCWYGPLP